MIFCIVPSRQRSDTPAKFRNSGGEEGTPALMLIDAHGVGECGEWGADNLATARRTGPGADNPSGFKALGRATEAASPPPLADLSGRLPRHRARGACNSLPSDAD